MRATQKLILDADVQRVFDAFAACFGVRMAFFTPDLQELRAGFDGRNSPFCTLLQQRLGLLEHCRASDRCYTLAATQAQHLVTYCCHTGLTEAVMPVYVSGLLAGYVIIGQIRTTKRLAPAMREAWRERFGATEEIEIAFRALPYITSERLQNMLNLFEISVEYLLARKMIAVGHNLLVETVIGYVAHQMQRNIPIAELEHMTGKSASTIARAFQQALGKSLKKTMIEMKLDAADQYAAEHPMATVTETAMEVGYNDPFYFSRLYKKYRQVSPSTRKRSAVG